MCNLLGDQTRVSTAGGLDTEASNKDLGGVLFWVALSCLVLEQTDSRELSGRAARELRRSRTGFGALELV